MKMQDQDPVVNESISEVVDSFGTLGSDASPESFQAFAQNYADWAVNKLPRGAFLSGEELNETGWELRRAGETVQSNLLEAGTELGGQVAGFFLIQAVDIDTAVGFARTTPHLKYGGTVEVRPIAERPRE